MFSACVRLALLHGSERLSPRYDNIRRLRRNDSSMIHWMYWTKPQDKTADVSLLDRLELLLHRLRWYGHVRRSDCIHAVTELEESFPGRPFKT